MSVAPDVILDEPIATPSSFAEVRRRFRRLRLTERTAVFALVLLLVIVIVGPLVAAHDPTAPVGDQLQAPGNGFLLGTDELGHDIFTRILYGARQSWLGAIAVIASGVIIGTIVGLVAGAVGGWVDAALMRVTDVFLSLPAPVLALAIAAALGRSYTNTLIAVAVVWWPLYARIVRAEVKAFTARPFMEAAVLSGAPLRRRWLRHLLPGAVPPIVIAASLDVGGLILTVAGLSFLGLGAPQPAPELGAMAAQGIPYLLSSSWVSLFPALAIFIIALVTNLAGDAIRELLED